MSELITKTNNVFYSYRKKLTGIAEPLTTEYGPISLPVKGVIPSDIAGSYCRNGPNQKFAPYSHHHLVDGHGMLHQFKFLDEKVIYTNRWIKTKIYLAEEKYQQGLVGSFIRPFNCSSKVKKLSSRERTKANTNVIYVSGSWFAFEEGGIPYIINAADLSTKGPASNLLSYKTTFTGHPKVDYVSGKTYCLNWNGEPEYEPCTLFILDKEGRCEKISNIKLPYRAFIHDFAITEHYILIPIFPCVVDYELAKRNLNKGMFEWRPENGSYLIVLDKFTHKTVYQFDINVPYAMHTCNAFELGDNIYLDLVSHEKPPILLDEEHISDEVMICSQLTRISVNLRSQILLVTAMDDKSFLYNFPRIDDKKIGKEHRYIYSCLTQCKQRKSILYNESLAVYDTYLNNKVMYSYGKNWFFNEPVFAEGNGQNYLMSIVSNPVVKKSKLLVFFENDIEHGPVAEISVPDMISYGFHGCWQGEVI